MKIVLFSLLFLIFIGMASYSYAQFIIPDENTELQILLQLELRDNDDNLVAYIESNQLLGYRSFELDRFLDSIQNKTMNEYFTKDNKKYEIMQWEKIRISAANELAYSVTTLLDNYQNEYIILLSMRHDSFQTEYADKIRTFWTVIRPVN